MRKGVRQRASENLKEGFWFPAFQRLINFHYTRLSLGFRFKNWLTVGDEAPRGAAELYQILVILLGAGLLALVSSTNPLPDWLAVTATIVAVYFTGDLLVFSLHWTFVADRKLKSYRRSLATFLLNLAVQVPLFFTLLYSANGCLTSAMPPWSALYSTLASVLSIQLPTLKAEPVCAAFAHYQVFVATIVLGIIVASIVGAVIREEKSKA